MASASEFMYAILSMDAYLRGYESGIERLGGINSSVGDTIGTAIVENRNRCPEAQSADFYAVAYEWNGETIISY